jgi:hypothetical protein
MYVAYVCMYAKEGPYTVRDTSCRLFYFHFDNSNID